MIDQLVKMLTAKLGIPESLAKQALGMVMNALKKDGEGDLVTELGQRIPGLAELSGGGGGLMGAAASMFGGGGGSSALSGLTSMIGTDKMGEVSNLVSGFVGEQTDADLGERLQAALARLA
jgi:hypothetical protein